jgi:glycine cleavage system transcriptional repressor
MGDQQRYAVTVLSQDRLGIVADVTGAIAALGGDIADLRQSVLRGHFSMILLVSFPRPVAAALIRERIEAGGGPDTPFEVAVQDATVEYAAEVGADSERTYLLTARGPDRVGFVAAVSRFCAQNRLNILDLSTVVAGDQYIMILLVDASRCSDVDALRQRLRRFEADEGLSTVLQHHAIFRATNEVDQ